MMGPQINFSYKCKIVRNLFTKWFWDSDTLGAEERVNFLSDPSPTPGLRCKGVLVGGDAVTLRPQNLRTIRECLDHGSRWGQCRGDGLSNGAEELTWP